MYTLRISVMKYLFISDFQSVKCVRQICCNEAKQEDLGNCKSVKVICTLSSSVYIIIIACGVFFHHLSESLLDSYKKSSIEGSSLVKVLLQ